MERFDIALTAQDSVIQQLAALVSKYYSGLKGVKLVATRGTGTFLRKTAGLSVHLVDDGPEGGYLQLGNLASRQDIKIAVFLTDPLNLDLNALGVRFLMEACNVRGIPLAINFATADYVLHRFLELQMAPIWRCPDTRESISALLECRN